MTKPWKRLAPWLPGGDAPQDPRTALRALADVAEVRRQLDQAELSAVRVARRTGQSWTEIATMLAITRQSAWERWRDLDEDGAPDPATPAQQRATGRRSRRLVAVPDLVGLTSAEALAILTASGLEAVSATPDIALVDTPEDLRPVIVVRQYPDSGTRVAGSTTVRLWLERGDGEAGVREPRRPVPPPRTARALAYDSTEPALD